ncbi:MAG TPA: hypothetical protein VEC56_00045 [Candidatus Krumholzibacteria bacterium]|nr:hypothetical protein [Candidatus Krumholzibacteria bacterium]
MMIHSGGRTNRRGKQFILLGLSALVTAAEVGAQESASIVPGERIRLRSSAASSWIVGNYLGTEGDRVRVQTEAAAPHLASTSSISELEVSRGSKSHAGRGAIIGMTVGAVGGIVAIVMDDQDNADGSSNSFNGMDALAVPLFAALGAGVGALVGGMMRAEQWVPMSKTSLSIGPASRTMPIGVALTIPMGGR